MARFLLPMLRIAYNPFQTRTKGECIMKKLAFGAVLCSLALFLTGCNDTAKQKDKVERTVKTDQDTGETTIKEEGRHTDTDDETGAKVETSIDKETTVKPGDEDDANRPNDNLPNDNAPPPPADTDSNQ